MAKPRGTGFATGFRGALVLALGLWALLVATPAFSATFTAALDRNLITLGEQASLSLQFENGEPKEVPVPTGQNLQISYVGPNRQVSIVNGQMSSSITHVFTVTAAQPGEYTIGPITANVGGQNLRSQAIKLTVVKPSAPAAAAVNAGTQLAFLRFVLPKREFYVNEVITAELQILLGRQVQNIANFQITSFPADGFVTGKMLQGQSRRVQVGNAVYSVLPVTVVLRPVRPGTLDLGPVTASAVLDVSSPNRRGDPFMEQFGFQGLFGATDRKQVTLATEPEKVTVRELPSQNVPPGFTGAVGNYTMTASVGPTNVAVGDPITVRVRIVGRGALDSVHLPENPKWKEFRTYPPTSNLETTDNLGLEGTQSFEQVLVAQNTEVRELPEIVFSFFDPEKKAYQTLKHPRTPLTVRPAGAEPLPTIAGAMSASASEPPPTRDIVGIKRRPGTLAQVGAPWVTRPWYFLVLSLPLWLWLATVAWQKRAENLARNPRLLRRRRVEQLTRRELGRLRELAAANQSDEFFSTLFHLLQEQLGEKLDLPATAITEAAVDERLRPAGVADDLLNGLHELFQACNQARYAPVKSSEELSLLVERAEQAAAELRRLEVRT